MYTRQGGDSYPPSTCIYLGAVYGEVDYMNKLVFIKKDEVFTNSKLIAENAEVQHHTVTKIIRNYKSDFEEFGKVRFIDICSINSKGGRPEKLYLLNEQQATLLLTYLKNTEPVREFKKNLVRQFYKMREELKKRQTSEYKEFRLFDKEVQKQQMKLLHDGILDESKAKYIKANTITDKAVSNMFGYSKMIKKEEMTAEMLIEREKILNNTTSLMIAQSLGIDIPHVAEIIYSKCKRLNG